MLNRLLILVVFFVFVAPGLWIGSGLLFAQTQDASSGIPRTPDGHPDLTGFYDVATITPVELPADYGERLFLSDEEVAAMVQYEEQRNPAGSRASRSQPVRAPGGRGYIADELIPRAAVPGRRGAL